MTYPASPEDTEWSVWALIDNLEFKPARKVGEKLLHYMLSNLGMVNSRSGSEFGHFGSELRCKFTISDPNINSDN